MSKNESVQNKIEDKVKEEIIEVKKEEIPIKTLEPVVIPEIKKDEIKIVESFQPPMIEKKEEEIKKEEDNNSWKKPKVKKEVPEDVLRKVLE